MEENQLVEEETEQVYCNECQRFLADRFIEGTCPVCGRKCTTDIYWGVAY